MKNKTKRTLKKVLTVVLAVLTLGAVASLITSLVAREENEIHPTFEIGGLDTNGEYEECKDKLFTPDVIEYNEFSVALDFQTDMKYQLYFYDENDEFVSKSEVLDNKYVETTDETKYVRILLLPTWEDDVKEEDRKLSLLDKTRLVKKVTICAKVNEVEEVEMIEFSIYITGSEQTFKAEKGMTWAEFVDSDYSTTDINGNGYTFTNIGTAITVSGGRVKINETEVTPNDLIESITYNWYVAE